MLSFLQKYKLFLCIGVALFFALIYDNCRNDKNELPIQPNPIGLENPDEVKTENILGRIEATKLFTEFTENEQKAREKYIGKTYLITGRISEVFDSKSLLTHMRDRETRNFVAGIMLIPENGEFLLKFRKSGGVFENLPETRSVYPLERKSKNTSPLYSDYLDFSHRSKYGGVYCVFSNAFAYKYEFFEKNPEGFTEQKKIVVKKIELTCRVSDYKKGGVERIFTRTSGKRVDPYADDFDDLENYGEKSIRTENRVILVDCEHRAIQSS